MAFLVYQDLIIYYNVYSSEITNLSISYSLLATTDAMQYYETLKEEVMMRKNLVEMYKMKSHFDQFD
jgi:hypothetical protein